MSLHVLEVRSFLSLSSILLYGCTTVGSIHQLMGHFSFQFLIIMNEAAVNIHI